MPKRFFEEAKRILREKRTQLRDDHLSYEQRTGFEIPDVSREEGQAIANIIITAHTVAALRRITDNENAEALEFAALTKNPAEIYQLKYDADRRMVTFSFPETPEIAELERNISHFEQTLFMYSKQTVISNNPPIADGEYQMAAFPRVMLEGEEAFLAEFGLRILSGIANAIGIDDDGFITQDIALEGQRVCAAFIGEDTFDAVKANEVGKSRPFP